MGPAAEPDLEPRHFEAVARGGNVLRGEASGTGPAVVQAHGITAARKYVTHGSKLLQRRGLTAVAYDARGHGESGPAPAGEGYEYPELARDMGAVVESQSPEPRVVIAGHSMGAHTGAAYTLANSDRVAGLVAIGPSSRGTPVSDESIAYWDRLADGLESDGVDGFMLAFEDMLDADPNWRETVLRFTRERMEQHRHPQAVADALRGMPRSQPFDGLTELESLDLPALVVASHDDADPAHPYAVAEAWAQAIPGATFVSEEEGEAPLAWQGGKLAREIAEFCERLG